MRPQHSARWPSAASLSPAVLLLCSLPAADFTELLRPRYRRPLAIGMSLMLFQQITGQPSVLYYAGGCGCSARLPCRCWLRGGAVTGCSGIFLTPLPALLLLLLLAMSLHCSQDVILTGLFYDCLCSENIPGSGLLGRRGGHWGVPHPGLLQAAHDRWVLGGGEPLAAQERRVWWTALVVVKLLMTDYFCALQGLAQLQQARAWADAAPSAPRVPSCFADGVLHSLALLCSPGGGDRGLVGPPPAAAVGRERHRRCAAGAGHGAGEYWAGCCFGWLLCHVESVVRR